MLGDGGQLQQALLNLLLNAEQAMRARTMRRIRVGARHVAEADAVELFIADSGHGIPDENLRRIFDPFFTTREVGEGTGLGLSICYGIVRDHGGQIAVESRVGQGTTFKVLLPARARGLGGAAARAGRAPRLDRARLRRGGADRVGPHGGRGRERHRGARRGWRRAASTWRWSTTR